MSESITLLARNLAGNFGVTVPREVGKDQFGLGLAGLTYFEEVDAASAPRRGTSASDLRTDQGIDKAGLAHVGAAEKSDFRQGRGWEVSRVGCRRDKAGQNSHVSVCNAGWTICKVAGEPRPNPPLATKVRPLWVAAFPSSIATDGERYIQAS